MSLKAWAGFIAVSLCCMIFYTGILPVWDVVNTMALSAGISEEYMMLLDRSLYWAPLVILIAALIHAVTSPAFRRRETWRN